MNTTQEDGHPGGTPEGNEHQCGGRGQTILARPQREDTETDCEPAVAVLAPLPSLS
jgi:hypothetical protein